VCFDAFERFAAACHKCCCCRWAGGLLELLLFCLFIRFKKTITDHDEILIDKKTFAGKKVKAGLQ
jgi:hypothetical protein